MVDSVGLFKRLILLAAFASLTWAALSLVQSAAPMWIALTLALSIIAIAIFALSKLK